MARRIAMTTLNASTIDILNTIRANASYEYQTAVPEVKDVNDIPKVGEVLYGYPTLANLFINSLVNRIALVKVKSALFNNAYAELKKGYLEFGETVEEVFVNICKAREFSPEKAEAREFKRTLPDVRTAFHTMNWRVQYPVTIQHEDLRMAFTSVQGVQDLIAKIINAVYTGAEYDEYLLFKYLIIKGVANGKMFPVKMGATAKDSAKAFRGMSNKLTFMSDKYNAEGVHTTTPKSAQYIFMDSDFNATYDVEVLAGAFNMDKAEFIGKLKLIDDFTTFDNDRFAEIMENTGVIPPVTDDELALMVDVKAVLVDEEWFQIYDNHINFTDKWVASGEYWNYFLNVWKTVSFSPFSNAVVFVSESANTNTPATITVTVTSKTESDEATVLVLTPEENISLTGGNISFVQSGTATGHGIAVHPYGAIIIPASANGNTIPVIVDVNGVTYISESNITNETETGTTFTLNKGE